MKHPYPLRIVLPTAAVLLGASAVGISTADRVYASQRRLESETRAELVALGGRTAAQLEYHVSRMDIAALERDTALLSSEPQLSLALVLDETDRVIASTQDALRDRKLPSTPARQAAAAIARVRAQKSAAIEHAADGRLTWGAFAFTLARLPGELRPSRSGVLYLELDLTARKQQILARAWLEASVMAMFVLAGAGAAWRYFDWTITRRAAKLVAATRAPDGHFAEQAQLGGSDELAQLSAAFTRMAASLQERNAQLEATRNDLEQRVAERTEALRLKNKELETFCYSVSHDLKAPLRGIDGYSRLLLEDYSGVVDAQGQMFLGNVRQAVSQMTQLIDDLLAYSRVERRALALSAIELDGFVRAILQERERELRAVELSVELGKLRVLADPEGLASVLRNLIDNACKFSAARTPPRIALRAALHDDRCVISVQDNGTGFDMRFHDKIFVIFQRLQRTEDYPGTGIGLAIVHKAVERMHGRVWAESEPDRGATFHVELPLAEASDELSLPPPRRDAPALPATQERT